MKIKTIKIKNKYNYIYLITIKEFFSIYQFHKSMRKIKTASNH